MITTKRNEPTTIINSQPKETIKYGVSCQFRVPLVGETAESAFLSLYVHT
jgi:hypothetical protein